MRKFYEAIVDHKKTVIVFFTIAMIISALCSTMVNVNYDMNDYLPDGTHKQLRLILWIKSMIWVYQMPELWYQM